MQSYNVWPFVFGLLGDLTWVSYVIDLSWNSYAWDACVDETGLLETVPGPCWATGVEFSDMPCLRLGIPDVIRWTDKGSSAINPWEGTREAALGQKVNRAEKVAKKEQGSSRGRCLELHPAVETRSQGRRRTSRHPPAVIGWGLLLDSRSLGTLAFTMGGWSSLRRPVNASRKEIWVLRAVNPVYWSGEGHGYRWGAAVAPHAFSFLYHNNMYTYFFCQASWLAGS